MASRICRLKLQAISARVTSSRPSPASGISLQFRAGLLLVDCRIQRTGDECL
jgi:hypothetical protein